MGLKLSTASSPITSLTQGSENFDGEGNDGSISVENYTPQLSAEWFVGKEQIAELNEQLKEMKTATEELNGAKPFTFNNTIVVAKCIKVYDGDTAHFVVKYGVRGGSEGGKSEWIRFRCRCIGYNSAEMVPPKTLSECERRRIKEQAVADKKFLAELLLDKFVVLHLHEFDKYGRPLVDIFLIDEGENVCNKIFDKKSHVNSLMIRCGHGVPYSGHTSKSRGKRVVRSVRRRKMI